MVAIFPDLKVQKMHFDDKTDLSRHYPHIWKKKARQQNGN